MLKALAERVLLAPGINAVLEDEQLPSPESSIFTSYCSEFDYGDCGHLTDQLFVFKKRIVFSKIFYNEKRCTVESTYNSVIIIYILVIVLPKKHIH